jgi:hypothetical protein
MNVFGHLVKGNDRMKRPKLNEIDLNKLNPLSPGQVTITMSRGQWDGLLESAYEQGFVLLELDENEKPVRAYWKRNKNEEIN